MDIDASFHSKKKLSDLFWLTRKSASLLTCRRRPADRPQTVTQTLPLTLIEQKGD
jgi:hypothetical protein